MDNISFSEILEDFLLERSLTQTAFAQKIGVKQSQVSEWLKGKAKPGYDMLKRMSVEFGVSADYFLGIAETAK
ncbi:MAG: helix-turn-helix domain-containing protein [Clostridiales bacterium]|nr:helix-turn-helix domain-containing protein [Clostridiales bacterium]